MNPNICHDRKVIFIHNPKAAGMSFRKWLGFNGLVNHGVPTVNTPYQLWNQYKVVVVVRDPIERALSCYRFMTHESYDGGFRTKYPDIEGLDPGSFFQRMINRELFILAGQYKYTEHFQSNKAPDFLYRFEDVDTTELAKQLKMRTPFPRVNVGKNKEKVDIPENLYLNLISHYRVDYLLFGYRPKPYHEFMEFQEKLAA